MKISGMAAIVTGGASGMGADAARALRDAGARVSVMDVQVEALAKTANSLGALAVECDVTNATSAEKAVAHAKEAHGAARILINCAGIAPARRIVGRDGPMPLDEFKRVIDITW